jgi:hypothetical protein
MTLAETWLQLEADAPVGQTGRMQRRLLPDSPIELHATVQLRGDMTASRRALELVVATPALDDLELPAPTELVDVLSQPRPPGRTAIVLALDDAGATDLFAAMCDDVAVIASTAEDDGTAAIAYCGRFERWRRMLKGGGRGLPPHRQRGLYAELLTLEGLLTPCVGLDEAILAWLGPEGAPRDFEIDNFGIETKSSAANEPQVVLINGERQLDDHGLRGLVLVHFSLEGLRDGLESLPALVARLRAAASDRPTAGIFEERLIQSGYHDLHSALYRRTGYALRRTSLFIVDDDFPRIVEADLADAVGDVRYSLAIDACRENEIDRATFEQLMSS